MRLKIKPEKNPKYYHKFSNKFAADSRHLRQHETSYSKSLFNHVCGENISKSFHEELLGTTYVFASCLFKSFNFFNHSKFFKVSTIDFNLKGYATALSIEHSAPNRRARPRALAKENTFMYAIGT